ncbi:HlyD family secretion protein [Planctomyces sp. SH-PL14]|uniref:HlyD family secretion protein n=1 Tax=Planctomyces sp. SH-PL14 TaxID=1632864 RepID=UPI00078B6D8D|nr:HlyD family efflux transporter periplasmic adaptor subunit [Planctomyces sp. SH-PL14]AMV22376.1 Chromosome partition protein Smc [Planctomyces sp. SH-PL14]
MPDALHTLRTAATAAPPVPAAKPRSRMTLAEVDLPALQLVRTSRLTRRIARSLVALMILGAVLMTVMPWQQSVKGSGNVVAFSTLERTQVIEAPVKGRIVEWGENIFENAHVTKGQMIVEIRDLDEAYASRLQDQLRNSEIQVTASRQQLDASRRALVAAETIVGALEAQVRAYQVVKEETIASQNAYVTMAREKIRAEQQQLSEYEAAVPQLQAELERSRLLQANGNLALQKVQEVERKFNEANAKVSRAEAYVSSASADLEGKIREREAKAQKAQVDIDYANATLQKAEGDIAKAEGDIAKVQQELSKTEKELLEYQVKVARQDNQVVRAPFDGILTQITPSLASGVIKEGDPLCTIVPETADRAVQVWLPGNDAPLVQVGRHVRLQFEGWPAIQFAGWPSVAIGTFGGEVISVDATDNGKGQFRVLVRPDADDQSWPSDRFLRQGVRANAWVLLDQVPLWYEFWRQLNGFPPVVDVEEPTDNKKVKKGPKLPK